MKRTAVVLAVAMVALSAGAQEHRDSLDGEECSPSRVHWGGRLGHVEQQTIDAASLRSLKVTVDHAPVALRGGNARGYRIEVCKAAELAEDLAQIRVYLDGSELKAEGPDGGDWTVRYVIHAPSGADVELTARNGPVSVRDLDGTLVARSANGPVALNNVGGSIDVETTNGPVSVRGGSGTMKVRASNGPLSITLDGTAWEGGSLDASTRNGPVTLKLPRGYASGVVAESTGRGPVACRAEGCEGLARSRHDGPWVPEPQRIELGRGPSAVRVATTNGPLTIKNE